ncbi:hypothetical protein L7F22_019938 [Adiantum nelumboides]|nr:hypothetical protein [Adiantum nelumboides]
MLIQAFSLFFFLAGIIGLTFSLPANLSSDSLASIDHVILFMQENRAFDHYYGTLKGVRGFSDPNVHISANTKKSVFHQPITGSVTPAPPAGVSELLPWHINAAGGDSEDRYQCMVAGSNGWQENHAFWNHGQIDTAVSSLTPYSLGYYKRADIPFHFALADAYTIGDAYHESIIAETNPNRMSWGGSTNGILQAKMGLNGPTLDNNDSPGCVKSQNNDGFEYSCFPYKWKTVAEYLEDASISWQVYQDEDNFGDNPFDSFENFVNAPPGSPLAEKGTARIGLQRFYDDAKAGKLPQVSYIVGPTDLSEHPPYGPLDGAWLQENVVKAVIEGANYDKSALIISYDETGGFADHVISPLPPANTPGEYIKDFYNASLGIQPNGPGFRVPLVVVSPWSRGNKVFTEISSHESQILFLEKWAAAKGKPFISKEMTEWRREQLSDLTKAFDFSKKDVSVPHFAKTRMPSIDPNTGNYNGGPVCQAKYPTHQPDVPYGKQTEKTALAVEAGYKQLTGNPSEGRYLIFEVPNAALGYDAKGTKLRMCKSSSKHNTPNTKFVIHSIDDSPSNNVFQIRLASVNGSKKKFITPSLGITDNQMIAGYFVLTDLGNGKGYSIVDQNTGKNVDLPTQVGASPQLVNGTTPLPIISVFSVTG